MIEPLAELVQNALSLLHPAFVNTTQPSSVMCEFYHQFRKFWDRGIPVGLGLGHLLLRPVDELTLGIHCLGESGKPDEILAAIRFGPPFAPVPGFPRTFAVAFAPFQPPPGVVVILCNPARGTAEILNDAR